MLEGLLTALVRFLSESKSPAVKMASAKMIEFVSEQLGCAIARHMSAILNQVLRSYPTCVTFGARERAAAASFSYDSMEDCFERLIDICCRLFPLTEHSVLQNLFDNTLIPIFLDGFHESEYLCYDVDAEEAADELMTTAVAQSLRVIYLVLNILGSDARVPMSLNTRILNMLVVENGNPRTPLLLRRTALHTWDAISKSLRQSALGNTVKAFVDHIKALRDYIPKLLADFPRPDFEYAASEDDAEGEGDEENGVVREASAVEVVKEEYLVPENSKVLTELMKKRKRRVEIVDRHTLGRLLTLIYEICSALMTSDEEEERYLDVTISLQQTLATAIADLLFSSLIDVSFHEAAASGNGPQDSNNLYEFGDINTQLKVVGEVLEELFESYWAAVSLLPTSVAEDVVKSAPIRAVLGWCASRMVHSAAPKGMLKLLCVAVRGLQHESNRAMYKLPAVPPSPHEVTFIALHRAHMTWFPQSAYEEAFDLMDILNESVAEDLMAKDLAQLIQGLGDQAEKFQARTETSLELMASIVSSSVPKRPDLAMSSLRALVDPSLGKQRIANGFPRSNRANTGSFGRRIQLTSSTPKADPMSNSLYIHVVLASCFDEFDSLGRAARRRGGPSYMGEKIDAFVEHVALTVRCLHACARARTHREYIGAVLGDIFGTCLAMQDHGDGRVRLAGFEIFAASLDVLFLAQKAMVLVPAPPNNSASEASILGAASGAQGAAAIGENSNGVMELSSCGPEKEVTPVLSRTPSEGYDSNGILQPTVTRRDTEKEDGREANDSEDLDTTRERKMQQIFADGGSCAFQSEDLPSSQLAFEERGWQMLCSFVNSSLGIAKYVDFVVQRACLEYLKGCMLNALRGRSTGASVIGFEHIGQMWDAVNRLIGSPWRTLNALALWVIIAILNVAIYSTTMARGRGAARQRGAQLNEFLIGQVFPRAEALLKSGIRETRVWGMRLLEAYLRARDLNSNVAQNVPNLPGRVLRCLDNLKHDWDEDVRQRSQSLLEIHFSSNTKKSNNSFTQQASHFMSMKRYQNDDSYENANSTGLELWFPPLPKQMPASQMDVYCRTLEAFANAEIEGGEEYDLIGSLEEKEETEDVYEGEYEDEEDGYEYGEAESDESEEVEVNPEQQGEEDVTERDDDSQLVEQGDSEPGPPLQEGISSSFGSDGFGGSEGNADEDLDGSDEPLQNAESAPGINQSANPILDMGDAQECSKGEHQEGEDVEDEDDVDDHEFSALESQSPASSAEPPALGQGDDDFGPDVVQLKEGCVEDEDGEEDDEVVDVTDEEDVLVDLDTVQSPARRNSFASDAPKRHRSRPNLPRLGLPGSNLNPDLDEGVQVLRRKGSFTSRPSAVLSLGEGDAPKLARRRSHDLSVMNAAGEPYALDDETVSPRSTGSPRSAGRRGNRSSAALLRAAERSALSSRATDGGQYRQLDSGDSDGKEKEARSEKEPGDFGLVGTPRIVRRRSLKTLAIGPDEYAKQSGSEHGRMGKDQEKDAAVGSAFLGLSPKGNRMPRGVKLDEDIDEATDSRRPPSQSPTTDGGRGKAGESGQKGWRGNRRSLPRAPAFVKGGGLQRRMSGGLSGPDSRPSDSSGSDGPASGGSGSLSSPSLSGGSRNKPLRLRGNANRPPRPVGLSLDLNSAERRADRSHRFSKREPAKHARGDDDDGFDADLLGDLDPSLELEMDDEFANPMRVGTPTAEALKGRNSLADDAPTSGSRRHGSNRSLLNSLHYKGLLDQISPTQVEDEPVSGGWSEPISKGSGKSGLVSSRREFWAAADKKDDSSRDEPTSS
ncbi:unnamed protein product [Chondrus crispus]|uniref:Uncharacterized protein n=1 Tax=Chondrus crispus TaxID=2769 RepID=R7QQS1_CHOCR|nr:unnamed protein product [Chondrus crispus]CDF39735.1 unnamed protein product [Chondrus crispus]|eukprot:XP_005710029.1 unnamed protein product [Chondrus crispus]